MCRTMTSQAWSPSSFGQELAQGTGFTLLGQGFVGQHVVNGVLQVWGRFIVRYPFTGNELMRERESKCDYSVTLMLGVDI